MTHQWRCQLRARDDSETGEFWPNGGPRWAVTDLLNLFQNGIEGQLGRKVAHATNWAVANAKTQSETTSDNLGLPSHAQFLPRAHTHTPPAPLLVDWCLISSGAGWGSITTEICGRQIPMGLVAQPPPIHRRWQGHPFLASWPSSAMPGVM